MADPLFGHPTVTEAPVLLSDDRDGVRTLTLNRPHRKNAINPELWIALRDALNAAGRDRGVRALVITGAGGSFCSGADISVPEDIHPKYKLQRLTDVALALHELPIPTVAKVTGVAVGAGWNLALGCDLVVATPESTFSQIFSKRGLSIDLGGSWLLPKLVGLQQAKRLTLLAETIDAAEAHALNLVTWVVPARGDRRLRRRPHRPVGGGSARRARPEQGAAERGRRPYSARRAGQRGPRAGRQFRDRRCPQPPMPPSRSGGSRRLLVGGRCQNPAILSSRSRDMRETVIVEAVRTPVGKRNGGLSGMHAADLSAVVLNELAERTGVDPGGRRRRDLGLRLPGRRPVQQHRPLRGPGRRLAREHPGDHRQPGVRIQPAGPRLRRAGGDVGPARCRRGRRCRGHEPRAARCGQGDAGCPTARKSLPAMTISPSTRGCRRR